MAGNKGGYATDYFITRRTHRGLLRSRLTGECVCLRENAGMKSGEAVNRRHKKTRSVAGFYRFI